MALLMSGSAWAGDREDTVAPFQQGNDPISLTPEAIQPGKTSRLPRLARRRAATRPKPKPVTKAAVSDSATASTGDHKKKAEKSPAGGNPYETSKKKPVVRGYDQF